MENRAANSAAIGNASTATPLARSETRHHRFPGLPSALAAIVQTHSSMRQHCDPSGRTIIRSIMKRLSGCFLLALALFAQPPIKPVPAAGIEVPAADRAELQAGLVKLRASIDKLKPGPLVPDVMVYHEAVRYALQ